MAANHQQMPQSTRMSGKRQVFTSFMSSPCSRSLMPNLPLYHQQRQWQRQRQWQQWHWHWHRHWQQQQQQQQQQHHHQHALRDLQNNRLQQENHNSWQHVHRPSSSASSLFPPPPTSGPGVLTSQRMMFWHPTRRPRVREKKHIIPGMHGLCLMGYSERGTVRGHPLPTSDVSAFPLRRLRLSTPTSPTFPTSEFALRPPSLSLPLTLPLHLYLHHPSRSFHGLCI